MTIFIKDRVLSRDPPCIYTGKKIGQLFTNSLFILIKPKCSHPRHILLEKQTVFCSNNMVWYR